MNGKKTLISVMAIFAIGAFLPVGSFAAVTMFAECAYSDTQLICKIFTDTGGDSLISGGVQLIYDDSKLSNPICVKNDDDWYFGESGGTKYPYMDPETNILGEIIYIVGKYDTNTGEGVNKSRGYVGKTTFTRANSNDPGTNPVTFFGLALAKGRSAPYINFVNTAGDNLDNVAVSGSIIVHKLGDANTDGSVDPGDMITVRNAYYGGAPLANETAADCNKDDSIDPGDMICIRNLYYNP